MNKTIKLITIILLILFLSLYFSKYNTNYYGNKNILTEKAIKQYEEDLKAGKEILPSNYLEPEKNYNNKVSKIGVQVSKLIEKTFSKGLKYIMKYLQKIQDE